MFLQLISILNPQGFASFYDRTGSLLRYSSVFLSLEPNNFQAPDQPLDKKRISCFPSTMPPGQARDFGVETSSVLMLRSLKKDPSGLELDPERMQVTRSNSWVFRDLTPLKTVKIHEGSTSFYVISK